MLTTATSVDDHSSSFGRLRTHLVAPDGATYRELRAGLSARWWMVWADGAITWVGLGSSVALAVAFEGFVLPVRLGAGLLAALGVGIFVHRLGLFVHEGVHGGVAPARANDLVTNLLGGVATLTDVRDYRPVHLAHHRFLGTESDTERTYMSRLDAAFVVRAMTGRHVASVLKQRRELSVAPSDVHRAVVLGGVAFHAAVIGTLIVTGCYAAAVAWAVGIGSIYPLVQSLRQLLEHRDDDAVGDLARIPADLRPFTRMFSIDRLGPLISGVGFNRHLLHHWDPGVSYTRLRSLERWLRDTDAERLLSARRSTYRAAFGRLWGR